MKQLIRAVALALLGMLTLFCLFGFLAAGEPGANHHLFRIGYAILGILSMILIGVVLFRR